MTTRAVDAPVESMSVQLSRPTSVSPAAMQVVVSVEVSSAMVTADWTSVVKNAASSCRLCDALSWPVVAAVVLRPSTMALTMTGAMMPRTVIGHQQLDEGEAVVPAAHGARLTTSSVSVSLPSVEVSVRCTASSPESVAGQVDENAVPFQ